LGMQKLLFTLLKTNLLAKSNSIFRTTRKKSETK
jgi:hypothetical protein